MLSSKGLELATYERQTNVNNIPNISDAAARSTLETRISDTSLFCVIARLKILSNLDKRKPETKAVMVFPNSEKRLTSLGRGVTSTPRIQPANPPPSRSRMFRDNEPPIANAAQNSHSNQGIPSRYPRKAPLLESNSDGLDLFFCIDQ